ncbi:hypothetical protein D3C79_784180 [compost metagenome]
MDAESASWLEQCIARFCFSVFQVGQDNGAALIESSARIGDRQAPGRALQQSCIEHLFERRHSPRHIPHRGVEVIGHCRKATHLNDLHEHRHIRKLVHRPLPLSRLIHLPLCANQCPFESDFDFLHNNHSLQLG